MSIHSQTMAAAAAAAQAAISGSRRGWRAVNRRKDSKRVRRQPVLTMVRTSAPFTATMIAGEASGQFAPTLSAVQTTDLIGMYDEYRINWMEFVLIPRYDPGQSGVTNNADAFIAACCDVTGQLSSPTFTQVTAFDNAKVSPLQAGKSFTYRFKPKAINALAAGSYAINSTDWLILSTAGAAVAHNQLGFNIKTPLATSVLPYDYVIRVCFSVKQAS